MKKYILTAFLVLCLVGYVSAGMIIQKFSSAGGTNTVSYGSSGATNTTATATLTLTKPASTASGDMLICSACSDTQTTLTLAGWTVLYASNSAGSSTTFALYKTAGGSEPASYDFVLGTAAAAGGFITRYTKDSGAWTYQSTATQQADNSPINTTQVTASQNGAMYHLIYGSDDYSGTIYLSGEPADMTKIHDVNWSSSEVWAWYESRSSGAVSKSLTITYDGSWQSAVLSIILEAQ